MYGQALYYSVCPCQHTCTLQILLSTALFDGSRQSGTTGGPSQKKKDKPSRLLKPLAIITS